MTVRHHPLRRPTLPRKGGRDQECGGRAMLLRRAMLVGALTVTAATAGAAAAWRWLGPPARPHPGAATTTVVAATAEDGEEPPEGEEVATVKTVHPRRDKAFTVTVHQFAT